MSSDYIGRINTNVGELNAYPGPLNAEEGGAGYARPLKLFVPLLLTAGVKEKAITRITQDNPRRFWFSYPSKLNGWLNNREKK